MDLADAPYLLNNEEEQRRRLEMLSLSHVKPLANYVASLRAVLGEQYRVPDFDPCDGGTQARVLFLLEAPGPKAVESQFVSSNNPDPTARNLWHLIHDAGIPRAETLIWNIVPWYVGTGKRIRPVNAADITDALPHLKTLLGLLPKLQLIVLVGRKAQSAEAPIRRLTTKPIRHTYHMSGQVFNTMPEKKRLTEEAFSGIAEFLQTQKAGH